MKAIVAWFAERTGCCKSEQTAAPATPSRCCCRALPCVVAFLFCTQAITGFFLWAFYSPSEQTAWESVYYFQYEVAGGGLLRAIHHYSAHALLAVLILSVVQAILTRSYRAPRELVFWATIGLGLFALAAVLTGDLLSWDQNGYAATKTRTGFLALLPWVGDDLLKIAIGGPGPALGTLSLTRFFAMHVGLFAGGFFVLLILRKLLTRRAAAIQAATECSSPVTAQSVQAWSSVLACIVVFGVVIALTHYHAGAPLLSPADTNPLNAYDAARPEWFLVGVYEFSHLFPGPWAVIPIFLVPGLLVCILLAMPFMGKHPVGQGFNVLFTVVLLAAAIGMTYYSYSKDRHDPIFQRAVAVERWQAERARELIQHNEGIPPAGALTLLRKDAKAEGRRLFAMHCASCHNHAPKDYITDNPMDFVIDKPTAPNLSGFASRTWIVGLLDPKQIRGPEYFGNTKLRNGEMPKYVKETLADLDKEQKEDLEEAVLALSAEAGLPSQRVLDSQDTAKIKEGRTHLTDDFGCTSCHKFHKEGSLGSAPELTGYGSAAWIEGIIRNPAHKRFYGKLNDRMPAYGGSADPAFDTLTPEQIKLLAEWLRGEWWEQGRD